jgi:hypothetical protein
MNNKSEKNAGCYNLYAERKKSSKRIKGPEQLMEINCDQQHLLKHQHSTT